MHPKYARLVQRSKEPQKSKIQHKRLFLFKPKLLRRVLGILILIVAVSWSFQYWIPSSKAYATPWSPTHGSYGQRKQLTLVNNSGQTFESGSTYKVSIDTASLYNSGSLLSTCDDLRVVYQPSSTTAVELKRAVEYASGSSGVTTCGTSSATKVVFQLQADMSNGSNTSYYYLYYDNPQATAYSSSDALDAYNVGAKEATFVAPFNGTTTALAAGSGTPTTATGAIRYSGGKSALSFDGQTNGSADRVNGSVSLSPGQAYTVEFWINPRKFSSNDGIIRPFLLESASRYMSLDSGGNLIFYVEGGCTSSTINLTVNEWIHVSYVNNGSSLTVYKNGVSGGTTSSCTPTATSIYQIGSQNNYYGFDGLIDEVRVSNTARYTSAFTPSTTPFVRDEYTKLLLHFDENGDDPRNTGKTIDDSGNGNHGTITGAKYVGGLIGVDGSSSNTSYQSNVSNQSYAGHEGVFIEEGTTNKITNPSFEHATYSTNWSSPSVFDYDSTADTFTAGMAKRNSAGPFAAGVITQAKPDGTSEDTITTNRGTNISGKFDSNVDMTQGSVVLWITPEWNGNDSMWHNIWLPGGMFYLRKSPSNVLAFSWNWDAGYIVQVDISSWTAGTTYNVVARWDTRNTLDGSKFLSLTINDVTTFGGSLNAVGAPLSYDPILIGSANAIIEGLTIYRRPLFDGTYGIDVGNGDEINQIYNSGTGKDPTLVTGSWDVVFALPTNASTGSLSTGAGNAWSHPHASNLLYTSTTNTGGFMMNGTAATDGWSGVAGDTQVLTLQPDGAVGKDTSLSSFSPTNNYGTSTTTTTTQTTSSKALMQFDVSSIPSSATVVQGTLSTYLVGWAGAFGATIQTYRGLTQWWEGYKSGSPPDAGQDGSTYNLRNANGEVAWVGGAGGGAGSDYQTTPTSSQTVNYTSAWYDWNITSDVAAWVATPSINYGEWLIAISGGGQYKQWASSDNATASIRPKLVVNYTLQAPTVTALATSEKIFSGGYKFTSNGANQGISRTFTATNGGDYVLRAMGHSDGTCSPQIKITRADGTTEITHLNGTTTSTRTAPNVYVFTWESPAAESEQVQLINTASTGTCYWHQVEVLSNLINNPSLETGAGDPWIPTGWTNSGLGAGEGIGDTVSYHSGSDSFKENFTGTAGSKYINYNPNVTTGAYYASGSWAKESAGDIEFAWTWMRFQDGSGGNSPIRSITGNNFALYPNVLYTHSAVGTRSLLLQKNFYSTTTAGNFDDIYFFPLTDVSLTVTPASEANSLESTGLRVDGTDTLTQTVDSLTATSGTIKFKYTPRHNPTVGGNFGVTDPVLAMFYANSADSIKIYLSSGRYLAFLHRQASTNRTSTLGDMNGVMVAGTTYNIEYSYNSATGDGSLKVNGVEYSTELSSIGAFNTVPTTAYWGSDNTGANQADATIAAPDFTGTVTSTENTTAPYYKFGTKSAKLVASADGTYVTSINPGNTNTHTLSAYVYDGTSGNVGGTVSATIAKMVFNGSVVTPASYTDVGGGWWRLSYSAVTANAAGDYGIAVLSGKTIYVDGVQLEEKAYATTYTDGTMGTGYAWTGTAHDSTSTRTSGLLGYSTTNNFSASAGSISFWLKPTLPSTGQWLFAISNNGDNGITIECMAGSPCYLYRNGGSRAGTGVQLTNNSWNHVTYTYQTNGTAYAYKNGSQVSSGTDTTSDPTLVATTYVNSYLGGGYPTNATMSDLKFYSSTLTSTEVADLYYSGLGSHSSLAPVATERYTDGEPPVLAWHLNEGYGTTAYDTTIYQNIGTISGATWSDDSGSGSGMTGKSLKFDGVNDYVSRAYNNDTELAPALQSFSVGGWFKHPSTVSGTDTLISRYSSTGSGGGYKVYMNSSGFICFGVDDDTTWGPDDSACTTVSYADSNWHHVLAIKGTSTIAVYIDGTQKASTAFTVSASLNGNTPTFYTGIDSDGTSNPWDGFIDEVRVYNSARSEEQINQEYIAKGTNKGVSAQFGSGGASDTLSQGLVGHWKMDEASWNGTAGEVLDASGNGNNGVRSGDATTAAGKFGNGGSFDGTGDSISTNLSFSSATQLTLSAWVYQNNTSSHFVVVGPTSMNCEGSGWASGLGNTYGGFGLYLNMNDGKCHMATGTAPPANSWHHVVGTYNGKNFRYYLDGALSSAGQRVYSGGNVVTESEYIGSFNISQVMMGTSLWNDQYYKGKLDDVRVYNRALSPVEVRALYEYAQGPVAHWTMDEGSGQSAYDKSGNSNTGTLGASSAVGSDDPTWTNGKYGKALSFDGSDDYVPTSAVTLTKAFTAEVWFKPTCNVDQRTLVSGTGGGTEFMKFSGSDGFALETGHWLTYGAYPYIQIGFYPTLNLWQHASLVFDGSTSLTAYKNGIAIGTYTVTKTANPSLSVLGATSSSSRFFCGSIDDVRIYNYARTQKQIVMDMNAGHPAVGSPVGSAVAHYKFDEGQGTTARNYGNGGATLNGTLTNMSAPATSTSGWTNDGKFSKALNFDGNNDRASVGNNSSLNFSTGADLTISLWFKTSSTGTTKGIIEKREGSGNYPGYALTVNTGNVVSGRIDNGPGGVSITGTKTVTDSNWHHLIMIRSADTAYLYTDGKFETSGSGASGDLSNTGALTIGNTSVSCGADCYFNGSIDEVKIYNYALSEDEVKVEYNQGKAIVMGNLGTTTDGKTASNAQSRAYCPPGNVEGNCAAGQNPAPVAEWNFDEGSGTSATDTSGNNNTGTLTNGPTWTSGKIGKGLSFDGSDDYVTATRASSIANNYTVEAWVKLATGATNSNRFAVMTGTSCGTNIEFMIRPATENPLDPQYLELGRCVGFNGTPSTTAVPIGVWSHVAVTVNGSNSATYYINGINVGNSSPSDPTIAATFTMGNIAGRKFNGNIDQFKIYNYARTPAQIAWDYNKGAPVAHYKFDECSGTTIQDWSPNSNGGFNNNDGTLTIGAGGTQTSAGTCSSAVASEAWNNGTVGKWNRSMAFDGTDDYVSVSGSGFSVETGSVTNTAWVKTSAGSNQVVYMSRGASGVASNYFYVLSDGKVRFNIRDNSNHELNGGSFDSTVTVNNGAWHQITTVWDTDTNVAYIYIDGKLNTSLTGQTAIGTVTDTTIKRIGSNSISTDLFSGFIDDVRIYNYALTDAQVKLLYNNASAVNFK